MRVFLTFQDTKCWELTCRWQHLHDARRSEQSSLAVTSGTTGNHDWNWVSVFEQSCQGLLTVLLAGAAQRVGSCDPTSQLFSFGCSDGVVGLEEKGGNDTPSQDITRRVTIL